MHILLICVHFSLLNKDESCNRTQNKHYIELPMSLFGGEIQAHFWNTHAYSTLDITLYVGVCEKYMIIYPSVYTVYPHPTVILKLLFKWLRPSKQYSIFKQCLRHNNTAIQTSFVYFWSKNTTRWALSVCVTL